MLVGVSAIPKSEATKLSNKTIPRPGSDDYLVELDVFHQLHCLNDLRKAFYPDRFPDKWRYTADGKSTTSPSTICIGVSPFRTISFPYRAYLEPDHCIDALRQTLQCHADVTPLPFHVNRFNHHIVPELATRHTCRDFNKIRDWAKQRTSQPIN
jgi:hypothetical protein